MAETPKKNEFLKGIIDLLILLLLLGIAGFGGYFLGVNERLAPVRDVPEGTLGAVSREVAKIIPGKWSGNAEESKVAESTTKALLTDEKKQSDKSAVESSPTSTTSTTTNTTSGTASDKNAASKADSDSKRKYWMTSSGADYTGYSITVKINGTPIDNFFGPGKTIDITRHVKSGDNKVEFEAKALGESYNKHAGDSNSKLTVKLVSGPSISESFQSADVILEYSRNASEQQDFNDSKNFSVK